MWISRLIIENLRALKKLDIFPRKKCVLLGENNAGKSTVMRALEMVLSPNVSQNDLVLDEEDYFDGIPKEKRAESTVSVELECELEDGDDAIVGLLTSIVQVDGKGGRKYFRVRYEFGPNDKFEESKEPSPRVFFPDKEDDKYSLRHRNWMPFYLLEALRDVRQEMRVNGRTFWGRLVRAVKLQEKRGDAIRKKVGEIDELLLEEELLKNIKESLAETLTATLGVKSKDAVELSFASPSLSEMLQALTVAVRHENRSGYSVLQHGLGLQNLIFFGVVRAFLDHNRKTVGVRNLILGIEEPEAHLHPHVQRTVFEDISGIPNQVFVATHSAHIANRTDPRDIVLLRRTKEGATARQIETGYVSDSEAEELRHAMDASRSEALFARSVLLVEGDSELLTLPQMAKAMGEELDRRGITLLSVRGTGFANFVKLFSERGLGIPHSVLADREGLKNLLNALVTIGVIDEKKREELSGDEKAARKYMKSRRYHVLERDFEQVMFDAGYADAYYEEIEGLEGKGFWKNLGNNVANWDKLGMDEKVRKALRGGKRKSGSARLVAARIKAKKDVPNAFQAVIEDAIAASGE